MTETTRPARANGHGEPCPPWCATDHSREFREACIGGGGGIGQVWTRAVRAPLTDAKVSLSGSLPDVDADWPHLYLNLRDAEYLAVIIELLAGASPDQHRELAAAIRQNAAQITEENHG
jgi:hypothetical protein